VSPAASQAEFLMKEYETARELTFHVDELRARLTSYFITLAGVAVAGLSLLLRSAEAGEDQQLRVLVVVALAALTTVGFVIVLIIGRLRAVQLEHFRIMNNVREYFLQHDVLLWNVVELSRTSLPKKPRRSSGSYFWVAAIELLGATAAGIALHVTLYRELGVFSCWWSAGFGAGLAVAYLVAADRMYMRLAKPPDRPDYDTSPNDLMPSDSRT